MHVPPAPRPLALLAPLTLLALAGCADPLTPAGADLRAPSRTVGAASALVVTSTADAPGSTCGSDCTLRQAITAAAPGDVITFASNVTGAITLTGGQLVITKALTITGPGAATLAIRGIPGSRVLFLTSAGGVSISGLTVRDGDGDDRSGGCIESEGTALHLTNVVVASCRSQGAGGGIGSTGNATAWGALYLDRVTVRDSWAANGGGGIYVNYNSTLVVDASTISNNEGREGGGIGTTGYVTVRSSTISGNRARLHGGGLYAADRDVDGMQVSFSTITGNTADADANGDGDGGGIFNSQGTLGITGSIVAGNSDATPGQPTAPRDCGALNPKSATGARNLIGSLDGCAAYAATVAVVNPNPLLGALADNGGPTRTHALLAGSPAIDAGGAPCPTADQRGVARPQGAACDIGAFEYVRPRITVAVDVRPGSTENPVSLSIQGTLPVAVLSSATFDARTVVVASVRLNGTAVATRPDGAYRSSIEDLNGDGRPDLLLQFDVQALGLTAQTTSVTLLADLVGGQGIQGTDVVRVLP